MKEVFMKSDAKCNAIQTILRRVARFGIMAIAVAGATVSFSETSMADESYRIVLTPQNDPNTGNFKVRIGGDRTLTAHVVRTPSGANAVGVTVTISTNLGFLSSTSETTDSNGCITTVLNGGWTPGIATVHAEVRFPISGRVYTDDALVPVVAPNGEGTQIAGRNPPTTAFRQRLTPDPDDVDFSGLSVTERDGGDGVDNCHWAGSSLPVINPSCYLSK